MQKVGRLTLASRNSRPEATIPGTGIYAGKLYTEEERAEIKRQNCLTHGQRMQENYEAHRVYIGAGILLYVLSLAAYFIVSAAEFAALH